MSILFKIGAYDFTDHVVNATYKVNRDDVNETYEDANNVTHFIHIRQKTAGSFDLAFWNMQQYEDFITTWSTAKSSATNSWTITVTPNNTLTAETIDARVTFAPSRELTAGHTDIIRQMTVTIEER